ncbi:hypothetical protein [Kordia jejudonensis]|uniref:hypothetical protein n=1 Tax=Kordia jejudonensis TaxID=1348245 RepID=UPI000629CDEF|nr:hypothetical protein [Kordia jejudonensis]
MITGETEKLIKNHYFDDDYDDFFGSKKKRRERKAKRKARRTARRKKRELRKIQNREKGGSFLKDVGNVYRDIGGATAIGGIIDSFTIGKDSNNSQSINAPIPSDYEFSVGSSQGEKQEEEDKKSFPTAIYVVGGIIVIGIIGLVVINAQKKK